MNLEEKAIIFIHTVANATDKPLFAGNSGGKDSAVVDYLLQKSGIEYTSIYANTTIDPIGTIKHIKDNYPHTVIMQPKETFYQLVERKGLPTRLNRYCCEFLKEYVSVGKIMFEGVRSSESKNRQNRDYVQCDNRKWQKGSQHVYPIYDWTDEDVYSFIAEKQIKLAPHYKTGAKRLGCVGCPLISRKGVREKEFELYPKYYESIKRAITKGMSKNPQWKLTCATEGNGELAMQWWLSGKTMNEFFPDSFEKIKVGWQKNIKKMELKDNGRIRITPEGVMFVYVNKQTALNIITSSSDTREVYSLHNDGSESLIEDIQHFNEADENSFAIEYTEILR